MIPRWLEVVLYGFAALTALGVVLQLIISIREIIRVRKTLRHSR